MAGKRAAIAEPGQDRKTHIDAGFGMPAAGQRRYFRYPVAAEDSHRGGGIGPHVEQAASAQFA